MHSRPAEDTLEATPGLRKGQVSGPQRRRGLGSEPIMVGQVTDCGVLVSLGPSREEGHPRALGPQRADGQQDPGSVVALWTWPSGPVTLQDPDQVSDQPWGVGEGGAQIAAQSLEPRQRGLGGVELALQLTPLLSPRPIPGDAVTMGK